jgi:hypothetical protein
MLVPETPTKGLAYQIGLQEQPIESLGRPLAAVSRAKKDKKGA